MDISTSYIYTHTNTYSVFWFTEKPFHWAFLFPFYVLLFDILNLLSSLLSSMQTVRLRQNEYLNNWIIALPKIVIEKISLSLWTNLDFKIDIYFSIVPLCWWKGGWRKEQGRHTTASRIKKSTRVEPSTKHRTRNKNKYPGSVRPKSQRMTLAVRSKGHLAL